MTRDNTIAETAQEARKRASQPAPSPAPRKNRLPLILGIIFLLLLIVAGVIAGLIFFGVINPFGEVTATPTSTPANPFAPIAEYNDCNRLLLENPQLYCSIVEVETDSTWTNALPTAPELINQAMAESSVAYPGAIWISPVNRDRPLERVFYLPEGQVDFARVRLSVIASFPLESITINGEVLDEGTNFTYGIDDIFYAMDIVPLRQQPPGSTPAFRQVNLRQFLHAGRNVIQYRFAPEDSIVTPEVTVNAEVTIDPNATEAPPPTFALLAQVRIPVTGEYNTVQTERYFSNADWQDSPFVGVYPTALSGEGSLGDAQWIQGLDSPAGDATTVSVERLFYLAETTTTYALVIDVFNGTIPEDGIQIEDAFGNVQAILRPAGSTETEEANNISFQRYQGIPISTGFGLGLNRLVIKYAPNSNVFHFVRVRLTNSAGDVIFVSDTDWLRGEYRAETVSDESSVTLTAPIQRGIAHMRGFIARPNSSTAGNVIITCLQERGDVPCASIQLSYQSQIYTFGSENTITLQGTEPLFSIDLNCQCDSVEEVFGTVALSFLYVDTTGASQNISASSLWYAYQAVGVITVANSAWTVVEDAAFINSLHDDNEGQYISVFETSVVLPDNAVVIASELLGSVDDNVLAIYINEELAYTGDNIAEDFRYLNTYPIDAALLREGDNRIVVHSMNIVGASALAMRLTISYFTQRN